MADVAEPLPHHEEDNTGLRESDSAVCKGDGTTCAECGKHFSHPFYFSTHISTHVSEKTFPVVGQCALCGIVFGDPEIFTQHLTSSQNKLAEQESAKEAEENLILSGDVPDPDVNDLPIGGSSFGMEEARSLPKSKQTKRLSQDKKSEVNKRTIVPSTEVPNEAEPLTSNTKVAAGTSSSRRKRKAPERFISGDDFAGVTAPSAPLPSDADSEVEAYLRSLSALGYTVDPEAFATPPRKKQAGSKLSGPSRGRAQGRGRGQSFFVLPPIEAYEDMVQGLEPQPPPRKPSPKYEYIEDDMSEFLEDDPEVLPKSGKLTRAQRLEKRLERLSQDSGEKKAIRHVYVSEDSPPRKSKNTGKGNKNFSPNKHPVIKPGMKNPRASIELDVANTDNDHVKHFKQGSPVPSKVPTARRGGTVPTARRGGTVPTARRGGTNTSNPLFGVRMYGNFMPKQQTQKFERGRGQMQPGSASRGSRFPLFPDATRGLTAKVTGNLEKTKQSSREYVEKMLMSVQTPSLAPFPFNPSNSSTTGGQKGRGGQGILSNSGLFLGRSTSNAGAQGAGSNPRGMGSNNQRSVQRGAGHMVSSGTYRHQGHQNFQNQRAGRGSNIRHNIGLNNRGRGSDQQRLAHGNNLPRSSAIQNNPFRNGQLQKGRGGRIERPRGSSQQNPFPVGSPSRIQSARADAPPPAKQQRISADTGEVIVIDDEDEIQIRSRGDSNHSDSRESVDISSKGEKSVAILDVGSDSRGSQIETIETKGNMLSEPGSSRRKSIPRRSENWNKADEMESESEDNDSDTEQSNVRAVDDCGTNDENENQEEEIMDGENIDGWKVCLAEDSESGDDDDNSAEEAKPTSPKKNTNKDNPPLSSKGDIPPSSSEEDNPQYSSKEDKLLSSSLNQSTNEQREKPPVKVTASDKTNSKEKQPSTEELSEKLPGIAAPTSPNSKDNCEGKQGKEYLTLQDSKTDDDKSNTTAVPVSGKLDETSHSVTKAGKFGASVDFTVEFSNDLFSNLVSEELDTIGEETSRSLSENSESKDVENNSSIGQSASTFPKAVSEALKETEESSNLFDGSQNLSVAQTSRELVSENSGTPNTTSTNSDYMGTNDNIVDIFTEIEKACKEIEENSSERENYGDDAEEEKEMESKKKKESFSSLREGLEKAMANEGRLVDTENGTQRKAVGCDGQESCDNDLEEDGIADTVEEEKMDDSKNASGISDDSEKDEKVEKEPVPETESRRDAKTVREKLNGGHEKIGETSEPVCELDGKSSNETKNAGDVLAKTPNERSETGMAESERKESQAGNTEQAEQSPETMEDDTELVKDEAEQASGGSVKNKISGDENSKCHSTNDMNLEVDGKTDRSLKENEDEKSAMDQTTEIADRGENQKILLKANEGLNLDKPSSDISESVEKLITSNETGKDLPVSTSIDRERTMDEKIIDQKDDERCEKENANEDTEAAIYQRILKAAMDDKDSDAIYNSERLTEDEEEKVDEGVGKTSKATEERRLQDSSEIMDAATEEIESNMGVTGDNFDRAESNKVDDVIDKSAEQSREKADDDKSEKIADSPHCVGGGGDASQRSCESAVTEKNENTDDTGLTCDMEEKEKVKSIADTETGHGNVMKDAAGKFISDSERTENDVNKTSEETATTDVGSGANESGSSVDAREGSATSTEKESANGKTKEKSEEEKKQRNISSCKDNSMEGKRQKNGDDDDDKDNGSSGNGGGGGNQSAVGGSNCNVATTNGNGNSCSSTTSSSNVECVDNEEFRLEPESLCSFTSVDSDINNEVLNIPMDACSSSVPLNGLIQRALRFNAAAGLETQCAFGKSRKSQSLRTLNRTAALQFLSKRNRICHKISDAANSKEHFLPYKWFVMKKRRNLLSEFPRFKLKLENFGGRNEGYGSMGSEFKLKNLEAKDKEKFPSFGNCLEKRLGALAFHRCKRVGCHPRKANPFHADGRERKYHFWTQNSRMSRLIKTTLSPKNAYSKKESSPTFAERSSSDVVVNCEELGKILEPPPETLKHSFKSELLSSLVMKKNFPVCLKARSLLFKRALRQSLLECRDKGRKEIYSNSWVKNTPKVRRKFPSHVSQNTKSLRNVWQNCKPFIRQHCSKEELFYSKLNFSHFSSVDCWTMTGGQQMDCGMRRSLRIRSCARGVGNKGRKGVDNQQNKKSSDLKGDQGNRSGQISPNYEKDTVQIPYKPDGVVDDDEDGNGKDNGRDGRRKSDVETDDTDEGDESDESENESDEEGDVNLSLNCPLCGSLLNSTEEARQHLLDHKTGKLNDRRWTSQREQLSTSGNVSTRQKYNSTVNILGPTDENSYKLTYRSSGVKQVPNGTREITFVQPTKPVVKHLYGRHRRCAGELEQIVVQPSEPVVNLCDGSAEGWLAKYMHPDEQSGFKENKNRSTGGIDCQELKQYPQGSSVSEKLLPRSSKMRNEFRSEMHCLDVDKGVEGIDLKKDKITQHNINRTSYRSKLSEQSVLGRNKITQPFDKMVKLTDNVSRSIMSERKLGKERIGSFSGSFPPPKHHSDKRKKKQQAANVGETKLLHYESVAFNQAKSGTKEIFLVSPLDNSIPSSSQAQDEPKKTLNSMKDLTSKEVHLRLRSLLARKRLVAERVDNEDCIEVVVDSDVDKGYHEMSRNFEDSTRSQDGFLSVSSTKNTAKLKKRANYKSEFTVQMIDSSCLNSLDDACNSRKFSQKSARSHGVGKFGDVKTHDRLSTDHCQGHISPPDPPLLIADVRSVKSKKTASAAANSQANKKSRKRKRGKNGVQKRPSKRVSQGCVTSMGSESSNQGIGNQKGDFGDGDYFTSSTTDPRHVKFPDRIGDLYSDSSNDSSNLDLQVTFLNEETQCQDNSCTVREVDTKRERNEQGEVISDSDDVIQGEISFITDSKWQENTASNIQIETFAMNSYNTHQPGKISDVKALPNRRLLRSASKLSLSSHLPSQSITSSFKDSGSDGTPNKASNRNSRNEKSTSSKGYHLIPSSSTELHHSSNHFLDQDSQLDLPLLITDVRSVMPEEFCLFGASDKYDTKSLGEKNGITSAGRSAIKIVLRDWEHDDISNDLPIAHQPEENQSSEDNGSHLKEVDTDEQMVLTGGITQSSSKVLQGRTIHNSNDRKQGNELPFCKPEPFDPEHVDAHSSVCNETEQRKITPTDDHQQYGSSTPLIKTEISDPIFDNIHLPTETIDTRPLPSENALLSIPSLLPSSVLATSSQSFPSSIISSFLSSSNDKLSSNPRIIKIMKKKRNLGQMPSKNLQNLHKSCIVGVSAKPYSNVGVRRSEFSPAYLSFKDMVMKKGIKGAGRVVRNVPPKEPSLIYVFPKKPVVNLGKQKHDWKDETVKHGAVMSESNPDVRISAALNLDEADKEQARQTKLARRQAPRKTKRQSKNASETLTRVAAKSTQENAKSQEKCSSKTGRQTAARKRTKRSERQKKAIC